MARGSPHDITRHLADFAGGDREAMADLLPKVYDELHRLAVAHFRNQPSGHTLQPTALVNEAYLKLAGAPGFKAADRDHFFVLASRIMRQVLVDHARTKRRAKRGGAWNRVTLEEAIGATGERDVDLLALDDALEKLAAAKPQRARLVELRFFGGLSSEQAGAILGMSRTDAARKWRMARAWLARELRCEDAA